MLRKNDSVDLKIEDMTNLGFGVGRVDGLVVFVANTVMGDLARVKIIKSASSYAVGKLEELIEASSERTEARCGESTCQSCAYRLISYARELEMKRDDVASAFKKAGLPDVKILDTLPSPSIKHYRNKAQYPITQTKSGAYTVGFYAPKSHRVTEARVCPLAPKEFPEIIETLVEFFSRHKISCYEEESGQGLLRHIYLRRGEISGEIMLVLIINGTHLPASNELVELLNQRHPEIKSILLNVNTEKTNVILGSRYVKLFGADYITDELAGVKLKLSAPAFYQVNHGAAELLYAKAKELADPKSSDTVLDLYCGVGSIGLSMADKSGELIGIEIVESAVEMARENAEAAGFTNAKFYTGDAKDTEKLLDNAERELGKKINPNVIILDPPRAGCDEGLVRFVASLSPERVVYISCNPQTLARDAKLFDTLGYKLGEVLPVDMFPGTGHVESVVCLTRK